MEYKNIYVAVCDILGFKDLIMNNDFETTRKIFEKFVSNLELAVTGGKAIQYNLEEGSIVVADSKEIKLNFNLFSDTVVLWTVDNSVRSFFDLLIGTANLFNSSMKYGLPLRGAISQGELMVNPYQLESEFNNFENIVYGKALIKAYQLEQDQIWSGCIIDPEFSQSSEIAISQIFKSKLHRDLYIFYNVPMKSSGCRNHLTLNWVGWSKESVISEDMISHSFIAFNKTMNSSVQIKLQNSLEYYRYSMKIKEKYFSDK